MKEYGLIPSKFVYDLVIGACVKGGNISEALDIKDEMIANGFAMNLVVATSLLQGYCSQGDLPSALNLFSNIVEDGITPNNYTYSVLIECCYKIGNTNKAHELYCEMRQNTSYLVSSPSM
uniref:Pentatricopeptide repeat-containing protein n=1 Tax=Ananas comosus var. bracteatus TaxID=296719 RepID=A0A6V7QWU8_ANACO